MTDYLSITSERTGTTARITAAGELDIASASSLRQHVVPLFADHTEIVVLDLTAISFIDSTGLHALLDIADKDGTRLRIVPSPTCLRLFEIAGVQDRLPLIDGDPLPRA